MMGRQIWRGPAIGPETQQLRCRVMQREGCTCESETQSDPYEKVHNPHNEVRRFRNNVVQQIDEPVDYEEAERPAWLEQRSRESAVSSRAGVYYSGESGHMPSGLGSRLAGRKAPCTAV